MPPTGFEQLFKGRIGVAELWANSASLFDLTTGANISAPLQLTISLTAAQIGSLFSSPVELIPAPASGYGILLLSILIQYRFGTTPYLGGGTLEFFNGDSGSPLTFPSNVFVGDTSQTGMLGVAILTAENTPISLTMDTGDFSGTPGDGVGQVTMTFSIVPLLY
jgi:hypothetical protein